MILFKIVNGGIFAYMFKILVDFIFFDVQPTSGQIILGFALATIFMLVLFVASFDTKITSQ